MKILKIRNSITINNILFNPPVHHDFLFDYVIFTKSGPIEEYLQSKIFVVEGLPYADNYNNIEEISKESTLYLNGLELFIDQYDIIINNSISLHKIEQHMEAKNYMEITDRNYSIVVKSRTSNLRVENIRRRKNQIIIEGGSPDIYKCIEGGNIINMRGRLYCLKHRRYYNL